MKNLCTILFVAVCCVFTGNAQSNIPNYINQNFASNGPNHLINSFFDNTTNETTFVLTDYANLNFINVDECGNVNWDELIAIDEQYPCKIFVEKNEEDDFIVMLNACTVQPSGTSCANIINMYTYNSSLNLQSVIPLQSPNFQNIASSSFQIKNNLIYLSGYREYEQNQQKAYFAVFNLMGNLVNEILVDSDIFGNSRPFTFIEEANQLLLPIYTINSDENGNMLWQHYISIRNQNLEETSTIMLNGSVGLDKSVTIQPNVLLMHGGGKITKVDLNTSLAEEIDLDASFNDIDLQPGQVLSNLQVLRLAVFNNDVYAIAQIVITDTNGETTQYKHPYLIKLNQNFEITDFTNLPLGFGYFQGAFAFNEFTINQQGEITIIAKVSNFNTANEGIRIFRTNTTTLKFSDEVKIAFEKNTVKANMCQALTLNPIAYGGVCTYQNHVWIGNNLEKLSDINSPNPTFTSCQPGTYKYTYVVVDASGDYAKGKITVKVPFGNLPNYTE